MLYYKQVLNYRPHSHNSNMGRTPIPRVKEGENIRKRYCDKHVMFYPEEIEYLNKLSRLTGLSANEVIRSSLHNIVFKEAPPKEFYDLLNKINNIGININQIAHVANSTGEIYFETLKVYFSQIEKFIDEIRRKFL